MKKLIIYDLDGTLVDTRQDIINSVRYALKELNGPPVTDDEIKDAVGTGLHSLIRQVFRTDDEKLADRGAQLYRKHYTSHMLDHSRLYPGARELLEFFKPRTQAVITNKPNPFSKQILEALGVGGYFIDVLAGDNGLPFKPDPASLFYLMGETKAKPEETLFIGDSPVDIQTARNAGVEIVCLSHGFTPEKTLARANPDYLVHHYDEILKLARQKKW
ncbi:MAG: Phosphoglycolate phosphatase [Candidatus Omnitrophica bacterium ADurb.Bin292]|jgi:phosphoglycolate phosphatase|nr:MAG: Phosphoglycolate phosphatase [Candidatus Omnitrophica bacterium ADurb.Bin292]HPW77264.1 HAD-IA family hydrolase [Candidatus Omnitrophota bacterium]